MDLIDGQSGRARDNENRRRADDYKAAARRRSVKYSSISTRYEEEKRGGLIWLKDSIASRVIERRRTLKSIHISATPERDLLRRNAIIAPM